MSTAVTAFIALGANLGDPVTTLRSALRALDAAAGVRVSAVSSLYDTSPVDSSGSDYVNAVARVETGLTAPALLGVLQRIENDYGRVRPAGVHNAPRTLDLDMLTYGSLTSSDPQLILPHPRMLQRLFVLVPLAEIEPGWTTPDGEPVSAVIERVKRDDPSQKIQILERLIP